MQVILLERIARLGQMGDEVSVKPGYARNFLLPKGKALRANKANRELFESQRSQLEARNLELRKEAEAVAEKIEGQSFIVIRQAGDTGQLYGSVSTRDITEIVTRDGFSIGRNQVMLARPIKLLGMHEVHLSLHPEVIVNVTVNVARSEEEAERQAKGEDLTRGDMQDDQDDDELLSAEDVFESEDLIEQAESELGEDDAEAEDAPAAAEEETAETSADDAEDDAERS
jgi:large subunit ribosomal protein L9